MYFRYSSTKQFKPKKALVQKSQFSVEGRTLFLNQQNCDMCNRMYPKNKKNWVAYQNKVWFYCYNNCDQSNDRIFKLVDVQRWTMWYSKLIKQPKFNQLILSNFILQYVMRLYYCWSCKIENDLFFRISKINFFRISEELFSLKFNLISNYYNFD